MVNMEKLKTLILSKEEIEFVDGINSGKVKLNFGDQEQTKKLKKIQNALDYTSKDKKHLEESIEENEDEIKEHEDAISELEQENRKWQEILDCLD